MLLTILYRLTKLFFNGKNTVTLLLYHNIIQNPKGKGKLFHATKT